MKRGLPAALLILVAFAFALIARSGSPGAGMTAVVRDYLGLMGSGDVHGAHGLLTDSLGAMLLPGLLGEIQGPAPMGRIELVHWESRGFVTYAGLDGGGSRTVWLVRENGDWRISGDTSIDNLLGRAASICRGYAEDTVVPAVESGEEAASYACPVTGGSYVLEGGNTLLCPAGHLGSGLDLSGDRCAALRDSLALVVAAWMSQGGDLPSSFEELYRESGGTYGQPGGFRCPDHGYSYYTIEGTSVYCPWHGEGTEIPHD